MTRRNAWCLGLALLLISFAVSGQQRPRIAIIIDDMGNARDVGRVALALPGQVTYAFLPHTPFVSQARQAHAKGREVMLHLPMQAMSEHPLGPGALTLHMTKQEVDNTLRSALASVPHASGVNNHMGSLLTRHPGAMQWLMSFLSQRGLYFIDSRTTRDTVAETTAMENAVAVARRHVFLDAQDNPEAIRFQYDRLINLARKQGTAVGIGHPRRHTLAVLAKELPRLENQGVALVPASNLTKTYLRSESWHASSSPLHKVAKNSKR